MSKELSFTQVEFDMTPTEFEMTWKTILNEFNFPEGDLSIIESNLRFLNNKMVKK